MGGSEAWSNGQRSRFRYGRFRVRTFLPPLISLWGSLAGPCNPMRLGHDCYSMQVRTAISCIRKGKNEVIQSWISNPSLERQASIPSPMVILDNLRAWLVEGIGVKT